MPDLRELTERMHADAEVIRTGGGASGQARQRKLGRLPVRERLDALLDGHQPFLELGLWAAHGMYQEWGEVPAAGVVTGIGFVHGRAVMVVANDGTVKAGAMFPQSIKKTLRSQRIAAMLRLPLVYLVDSAGVFLPLQEDVFPDEDDFGRIFRNNAVLSAAGIPQYAAVMGNCIAGGAYLPVLCDKVLMTDGSQLCLAGPALVKAAIGQNVDPEELGGAAMHAAISGTVDFREPDDPACLARLRSLVDLLPPPGDDPVAPVEPARPADGLYTLVPAGGGEYDMRDLLACLIDADSLQEYRGDFGASVVTAYARIGGRPVGVVANQRRRTRSGQGELHIGGVLYPEAADKAARFVMDCNQTRVPLLFVQDVQGFMVGKAAEQSGIIRSGAKLVNAISNSVVPKITLIVGGSYGAGHYAMCGKAYDPVLVLAWPNARYAVMGGAQAANTLLALEVRNAERAGRTLSEEDVAALRADVTDRYDEQTDIRHGAARGWVDALVDPADTRTWLATTLAILPPVTDDALFRTGVLQT